MNEKCASCPHAEAAFVWKTLALVVLACVSGFALVEAALWRF